jgi:hypothetical protein
MKKAWREENVKLDEGKMSISVPLHPPCNQARWKVETERVLAPPASPPSGNILKINITEAMIFIIREKSHQQTDKNPTRTWLAKFQEKRESGGRGGGGGDNEAVTEKNYVRHGQSLCTFGSIL